MFVPQAEVSKKEIWKHLYWYVLISSHVCGCWMLIFNKTCPCYCSGSLKPLWGVQGIFLQLFIVVSLLYLSTYIGKKVMLHKRSKINCDRSWTEVRDRDRYMAKVMYNRWIYEGNKSYYGTGVPTPKCIPRHAIKKCFNSSGGHPLTSMHLAEIELLTFCTLLGNWEGW